ncbi:FAD-linked sulfhydryl oxidase ERV1 [Euphorbia lathyris]|uniref:FAD-linked sulfhydryl oxidase ERV1 n=1 Tax=Euphorbia lathyris TaxID=212925 RepID=UPI003313555B
MSDNPLHPISEIFHKVSNCIQTHFSNFVSQTHHQSPASKTLLFSISSSSSSKVNPLSSNTETTLLKPEDILHKGKSAGPVTKEDLGRATWTFLHTLAAQYPENPTRQQKKDVKELMAIMSRMYPCKECADHFKEVLRANPVQAGSQTEFSQWLCHVHNVVNRSLGKLVFPCERVDARWGKLDCEQRLCDLQGTSTDISRHY